MILGYKIGRSNEVWLVNVKEEKVMQNIRVQFTVPNVEKVVNLDVMVNGEKRNMKFRVEAFDWNAESGSSGDLVGQLRSRIENYEDDWELYHIGTPSDGKIPITFKHKSRN